MKKEQVNQIIFERNGGISNFDEVSEIILCQKAGTSEAKILVLNRLGKVQRVDQGECK